MHTFGWTGFRFRTWVPRIFFFPVVRVTRRFHCRWHFLTSARQIANSDQRSFFQTLVDIWCEYVLLTLMVVIDRHILFMTGKVALAKACTMKVPLLRHCMTHGTAFAPSLTMWIVAMFSLHWSLPCWISDVDTVFFWILFMVWMRWLCTFFGSFGFLKCLLWAGVAPCRTLSWTASSMQTPILRTWFALDPVYQAEWQTCSLPIVNQAQWHWAALQLSFLAIERMVQDSTYIIFIYYIYIYTFNTV